MTSEDKDILQELQGAGVKAEPTEIENGMMLCRDCNRKKKSDCLILI